MGEEMSWGQHVFGWKTPESMAKVNVQAETNLHNMSGYFADHVFIAGTLLYGGIVPIMAAVSPVWRRIFGHFGVVVGSVGLAVGFIVVTLNQPYLIDPLLGREQNARIRDRSEDGGRPTEDFRPGDNPRSACRRGVRCCRGWATCCSCSRRSAARATQWRE